jgi:formylglycine-generating enzyme required for sulfatase activity
MFCPFCGTDNAADQKYCRNCGAVLPTAAKPDKLKSSAARPGSGTAGLSKTTPFVPPQPPDLPRPGRSAPVKDTTAIAQPAAPKRKETPQRLLDDSFATLQSFYLPSAESDKKKEPRDTAANLGNDDSDSTIETVIDARTALDTTSLEPEPEHSEAADQETTDIKTIQMGSIPYPLPTPTRKDDLTTAVIPPNSAQPPLGPQYEDYFKTLTTPQAPSHEEQLRMLKEMMEETMAAQSTGESGVQKTLQQAATPDPSAKMANYNETLEVPVLKPDSHSDSLESSADGGAIQNTLVMEALDENSVPPNSTGNDPQVFQTEVFSALKADLPYERSGEHPRVELPNESTEEPHDTLIFTPPPPPNFDGAATIMDSQKIDKTDELIAPKAFNLEDPFKTKNVPRIPRKETPLTVDPLRTTPSPIELPIDPLKTTPSPIEPLDLLKNRPGQPPLTGDPFRTTPSMPAVKRKTAQLPGGEAEQKQTVVPTQRDLLHPNIARDAQPDMADIEQEEVIEERTSSGSRRIFFLIAAAVLFVILIGASFWTWRSLKNTESQKEPLGNVAPNGGNQTSKNSSTEPALAQAPANMVLIPKGEYRIGDNSGDKYSSPEHKVSLNAFYFDIYEVTNEEYAIFIKSTGYSSPKRWRGEKYTGKGNDPVTGVSWNDARAYAEWAGKRLPTEEEWEAAASGADHLQYPWGNQWEENRCNTAESGTNSVMQAGKLSECKNPFGIFDISGNVWEWTSSAAVPYTGSTETLVDPSEQPDQYRIIRGGSFKEKSKFSTSFFRSWVPLGETNSALGFRCVKDAPQN